MEERKIICFYEGEFALKRDWELTCIALGLPEDTTSVCIEYVRAGVSEEELKTVKELEDNHEE
jgi:hypothetical protein